MFTRWTFSWSTFTYYARLWGCWFWVSHGLRCSYLSHHSYSWKVLGTNLLFNHPSQRQGWYSKFFCFFLIYLFILYSFCYIYSNAIYHDRVGGIHAFWGWGVCVWGGGGVTWNDPLTMAMKILVALDMCLPKPISYIVFVSIFVNACSRQAPHNESFFIFKINAFHLISSQKLVHTFVHMCIITSICLKPMPSKGYLHFKLASKALLIVVCLHALCSIALHFVLFHWLLRAYQIVHATVISWDRVGIKICVLH